MKKSLFLAALAVIACCTIQKESITMPEQDDVVFYASFEKPDASGTRVYVNEDLLLRWTAEDRVSIFNKITYNRQYWFIGETGDNSGGFRKVDTEEFITGNDIPHVVSVYPYQASTKITESEVLTVTLPAEQSFAGNTFGLGANTMVSVSEDNVLQYRNAGGYLVIRLFGEGFVTSVTLQGNKGEKLAGKASVTMPLGGTPTIVMDNDATTGITLTCAEPVRLGATEEESIPFWFVVPPTTFSEGFTITVNRPSGSTFYKTTSNSVTIERNRLSRMSPVEVVSPVVDDPDAILVTNPYVQKFLEEVNYPNTNNPDTDVEYSYSLVTEYPGGGPGEADIPPTHTITWTADTSAGDLDLVVWESDWNRTYNLPAGTSGQDLTNLVPGREYHYKVTSSAGGEVITEGSFKTKGLLHQVYFEPKVRNARDLGGWTGLNGKTVAFRKLFRGSGIHGSRTNASGKAEMRAEGIRAEVDLREASDVPSKSPLGEDIAFFAPGFDSGYNTMIRDNPNKVRDTFRWIVARLRENKSVYFHCAAGRDRTGTLAVLLEGVLGVSESDMAKDYELTYFSPEDWSMSWDDNGNSYYGHVRTTYSYKSIRKTIFRQTDSGTYQERIVKYLLQIGVPQEDIDDFRAIMLE